MAYAFDCKSAGAEGCGWKAGADSEELLAKVKEHAEQKQNVGGVTDTIVNYARSSIRQS